MRFVHRPMVKIHRQQGAVLFMTLIMLVLLVVIGFNALSTSDTQFRLVGNSQFQNIAKERAENAIAQAEQWIIQKTAGVSNTKNSGFTTRQTSAPALYPLVEVSGNKIPYLVANNIDPLTMTWGDTNSAKTLIWNGSAMVSSNEQRYIVELLSTGNVAAGSGVSSTRSATGTPAGGCSELNLYRITTRGESARGAVQFVQVIYSAPSC